MFFGKNMEETFEGSGFWGLELDVEIRQRGGLSIAIYSFFAFEELP